MVDNCFVVHVILQHFSALNGIELNLVNLNAGDYVVTGKSAETLTTDNRGDLAERG